MADIRLSNSYYISYEAVHGDGPLLHLGEKSIYLGVLDVSNCFICGIHFCHTNATIKVYTMFKVK